MKCTGKECQREQVFWLTEEESLAVERRNYILRSYEGLVAILARELAEARNPDAKEMFGGTKAPYTECGKQIPWIISNVTRARFLGMTSRENCTFTSGSLPDDPAVGDVCYYSSYCYIWNGHIWVRARAFWLRDAYPTYTSYYWGVNSNGYYDYNYSYFSYGIMPRLHL